jgi:hypothetical protein
MSSNTMRRGVVDASIAWTYTTWLNIAFLILAILFVWRFPKTGDAATLRMMNRPAAMGALSMEPSKSDSIKINLIGITRPIRISHQSSSRHHPIYPGHNGTQNAAIPDKHQAGFRT